MSAIPSRPLASSDLPWEDGKPPSVRCHWEDCPGRATRVLHLSLAPERETRILIPGIVAPSSGPVGRPPRKYPFCDWHIEVIQRQWVRHMEFGEPIRVRLAYHPDDEQGLDENENPVIG